MTSRVRRALIAAVGLIVAAVIVIYCINDNYVPTAADLNMWNDIALASIAPALFAFVVLYGFRSRWWKTSQGRSLFYVMGSLLLLFLLIVLPQVFGPQYPGRAYIRIAGYLIVSAAVWRLLIALIITQRRKPNQEDQP